MARFFFLLSVLAVMGTFNSFTACLFSPPDLSGFSCSKDEDCLNNLICHNQLCSKICNDSSNCLNGENCSSGVCVPKSDAGTENLCFASVEKCNGKDDDCDGIVDNNVVCKKEGELCDPFAKTPILCEAGSTCFSISPDRPRVCTKECNTQVADSCPTTSSCIPSQVCLQNNCTKDTDCGQFSVPQECVSPGGNTKYCYPSHPTGTLGAMSICNPVENMHCQSPHQCMISSNQSDGLCSSRCSEDTDCPSVSGKVRVCRNLSGNYKICFQTCSTSQDCPTKTVCKDSICQVE